MRGKAGTWHAPRLGEPWLGEARLALRLVEAGNGAAAQCRARQGEAGTLAGL